MDIRALRWITPSADKVAALTTAPANCQTRADPVAAADLEPSPATKREVGRLAFESPALLGGAAARMGLSCSSCHLNGRNNSDFFIDGVSGAPGTADVTSSLFSKTLGDGAFNPVPIPDLAMRDGRQIKDRRSAAFRSKVLALVVEEFDGLSPPPYVFEALLEYLDALDIDGCSNPDARQPVTLAADVGSVLAAFDAARELSRQGLAEDALLMARIARTALERVNERSIAPEQEDFRNMLVAASRAIQAWADGVRAGRTPEAPSPALASLARYVIEHPAHDRSLYNPAALRAALAL